MDLHLLDTAQHDFAIVDSFQSLVWTERYNDSGDVVLVVASNPTNRNLFVEGMYLRINGSYEVMMIETVSDKDGAITIVGPTMTNFLKHRILRDVWSTAKDSWNLTDTAGNIALILVYQMCVALGGQMASGNNVLPSGLGVSELISNLTVGTDPGTPLYNVAVPYGNVFDGVKMVCDLEGLGFRIRFVPGNTATPQFEFDVYKGADRTTSQSANSVVIFDSAIDTLVNTETLRSITGYKTHAYVWANGMTAQSSLGIAVAPGASGVTDWQRRTLMLLADDINSADYTATALKQILDQRARDALANNNYVRMTDGTLVPQTTYVYGVDYGLGDIIELRGPSNTAQKAQIVEYIRAQDATGERSYPTLSVIG